MKIYNQTKILDALLKPILSAAARRIGCKAKDVIVKITAKRVLHGSMGKANRYRQGIKEWFLKRGSKSDRVIQCSGFVSITIPLGCGGDYLGLAEYFYETALHEFKHVRDFHDGEHFGNCNRNWKNRPHEIRAVDATDEALTKGLTSQMQEAIIALGIAIEEEDIRIKVERDKRYERGVHKMKRDFLAFARGRIKAWEDCFEGEPGYDLKVIKSNPETIEREMEHLIKQINQRMEWKPLSGWDRDELAQLEIDARCIIGWCREIG